MGTLDEKFKHAPTPEMMMEYTEKVSYFGPTLLIAWKYEPDKFLILSVSINYRETEKNSSPDEKRKPRKK